jgi:hypothetical protein
LRGAIERAAQARQRGIRPQLAAIGAGIKMQQRVSDPVADGARRVVADKTLEIPDSLNERGTTNKRHSTRPGSELASECRRPIGRDCLAIANTAAKI